MSSSLTWIAQADGFEEHIFVGLDLATDQRNDRHHRFRIHHPPARKSVGEVHEKAVELFHWSKLSVRMDNGIIFSGDCEVGNMKIHECQCHVFHQNWLISQVKFMEEHEGFGVLDGSHQVVDEPLFSKIPTIVDWRFKKLTFLESTVGLFA